MAIIMQEQQKFTSGRNTENHTHTLKTTQEHMVFRNAFSSPPCQSRKMMINKIYNFVVYTATLYSLFLYWLATLKMQISYATICKIFMSFYFHFTSSIIHTQNS